MTPLVLVEMRVAVPPVPEFLADIHGNTIPWHLLNDAALRGLARAWLEELMKRKAEALAKQTVVMKAETCLCTCAWDRAAAYRPGATEADRRRAMDAVEACPAHKCGGRLDATPLEDPSDLTLGDVR